MMRIHTRHGAITIFSILTLLVATGLYQQDKETFAILSGFSDSESPQPALVSDDAEQVMVSQNTIPQTDAAIKVLLDELLQGGAQASLPTVVVPVNVAPLPTPSSDGLIHLNSNSTTSVAPVIIPSSAPVPVASSAAAVVPQPPVSPAVFPDVPSDSLEGQAANMLLTKGVLTGIDGQFMASKTLTRAELVTIIMRSKQGVPSASVSTFSDVEAGAWYESPVVWAAENKIVTGYADGTFQPNKPVSRSELAAILVRAYGLTLQAGTTSLSDVPAGQWFTESVTIAASHNLFTDTSQSFRPLQFATRSTAAIGICKVMGDC